MKLSDLLSSFKGKSPKHSEGEGAVLIVAQPKSEDAVEVKPEDIEDSKGEEDEGVCPMCGRPMDENCKK